MPLATLFAASPELVASLTKRTASHCSYNIPPSGESVVINVENFFSWTDWVNVPKPAVTGERGERDRCSVQRVIIYGSVYVCICTPRRVVKK